MKHPNVAQVFDAGTAVSGRPYFVMEHVAGEPVTKFCETNQLDGRQRLNLFLTICRAVQHAHQMGIIHRDIKPSNVLVAGNAEQAIPKVIDFGIAKATGQSLNAPSKLTTTGQIIGTLDYMSPEQARGENDIDTRSDVYSLGALLFELLTGETPFGRRWGEMSYIKRLEMIRDTDPQKPSDRRKAADTLAASGEKSQFRPIALTSLDRDELDWIVLKALKKDREERYESAAAFAADIQRLLNGEQVLAGPPSRWYRLRKTVRRNRVAVLAASVVVLALCAGTVGTTVGMVKAERALSAESQERRRANSAEITARIQRDQAVAERNRADEKAEIALAIARFLGDDLLRQVSPTNQADRRIRPDPDVKMRDLLDRASWTARSRFAGRPKTEAAIRSAIGDGYLGIGLYDKAIEQLSLARELWSQDANAEESESWDTFESLAAAYLEAGRIADAMSLQKRIRDARIAKLGPSHQNTLLSQVNLGAIYREAGRFLAAKQIYEDVLDIEEREHGLNSLPRLNALNNLAAVHHDLGNFHDAIDGYEEVRDRLAATSVPDHPLRLSALRNLAVSLSKIGRANESVAILEDVRDRIAKAMGPDHPETLSTLHNLSLFLAANGQERKATELARQIHQRMVESLGVDHPSTVTALNSLAGVHSRAGDVRKQLEISEEVVRRRRSQLGENHPLTLAAAHNLAAAYAATGRTTEAFALYERVRDQRGKSLGDNHADTLDTMHSLADAYLDSRRVSDAITLLENVIAVRRERLGPSHTATLSSQNTLAVAFLYQGKAGQAMKLLQGLQGEFAVNLGPHHPKTRNVQENLADAYCQVGRHKEAVALLEPIVDWKLENYGPTHPSTLASQNSLASIYSSLQRLNEAEQIYEKVHYGFSSQLGANHFKTMIVLQNLAVCKFKLSKREEALQLIEEARERFLSVLGDGDPRTASCLECRAAILAASNDAERTAEAYRELLGFLRKGLRANESLSPSLLEKAGRFLVSHGFVAEAEGLLRECLATRESIDPNSHDSAVTRSLIGRALLKQGRVAESEPFLAGAVATLRTIVHDTRHPRVDLHSATLDLMHVCDVLGRPEDKVCYESLLQDSPSNR
jgi:tetratricopeptide (TPR) repeat protein